MKDLQLRATAQMNLINVMLSKKASHRRHTYHSIYIKFKYVQTK